MQNFSVYCKSVCVGLIAIISPVTGFSFYTEDESGMHLRVQSTTVLGKSWILREYQAQDFEDHWRIIIDNTGVSDKERKQYRVVDAASKKSVQTRRERSLHRFASGMPWGIMSILDDQGRCIGIFGLGRRTGKEGPIRLGHGHMGLTWDLNHKNQDYISSFLSVLTTQLGPEIRRLGDQLHYFREDVDPNNEQDPHVYTAPLLYIDASYDPCQEEDWKELLRAGFKIDQQDAIDWREQTKGLSTSTFSTLAEEFFERFRYQLVEYQRYLIIGPASQELVVWYSPKWGGIKLCFTYKITPD